MMPRLIKSRLDLSFHADLMLVNLEEDRSLEKSDGENQAQRLLTPNDDADDASQRTVFDSHPLAHLKERKRLKRKV